MTRATHLLLVAFCIALTSCSKAGNAAMPDTAVLNTNIILPADFAKGADIGWLSEMEDAGIKFYDSNGVQMDCIDVLKSKGINSIRLRVWVNPAKKYCAKADVVAMAIRARNKGMRLMVDFHYSDHWADPGQQVTPAAWANFDLTMLQKAVYDHTYDVINTLKSNGITPEWVQVGNETNDGFMYPLGRISIGNGAGYAKLVSTGYDAVKAVNPAIKVIVHVSNGYNNALFRSNFDTLAKYNAKFDVMAMSVYPDVDKWQDYLVKLKANMADMIARYGKPIMISEVGMDVNSPQATKDMLTDLLTQTASFGNNGLGVFYWEPESNNWNNYKLGAFDSGNKPTIAMDAFLLK